MTARDRVIALLYKLLRDELPAGVLEQAVQDVESIDSRTPAYSNSGLAHYAAEVATRLGVK